MREFKHPIPIAGRDDSNIKTGPLTSDEINAIWQPGQSESDVRWNGRHITVKKMLSFRELSQFINQVMDFCFDPEHEIAIPEAADFAIRLNVLMMYAGIVLTCDIDEQYRFVYESGLYEAISASINPAQLESIRDTVKTCILHMT